MANDYDVIIIGAGAAGLMCAATAAYRGRKVLVIDHANKPGKKILMSGGGRCNFTNLNSTPANFLSSNPHFCISALKRYTPQHFLDLVERHGIEHEEKAAGQLFCKDSSKDILNMLLTECEWSGATIQLKTEITGVSETSVGFQVKTNGGILNSEALVVACGGLSIPTMGATGLGYEIARQFGLNVLPTRAGLVPFTLHPELKDQLAPLSGVSCDVDVHCNGEHFREPMLITHRGLSGPSMLQISSFWQPGDALTIDLLPGQDAQAALTALRQTKPQSTMLQYLNKHFPRRFAQALNDMNQWQGPLQALKNTDIEQTATALNRWTLKPAGTEGYRTSLFRTH
ncbi:NAD(P)/FAD-dependent oxidoreductase [Marinobacter sp. V034]|uniref:NAD(P)/FAD-dependent oxidoreductase n=1 Tax=Marinobacter sp. V034 TaxID=3459610 RepID=UPI004043A16E